MENPKETYLTPEQVAEKLQLTKTTVYRMCRRGELPAVKLGKSWRISSQKLAELMEPKSNP